MWQIHTSRIVVAWKRAPHPSRRRIDGKVHHRWENQRRTGGSSSPPLQSAMSHQLADGYSSELSRCRINPIRDSRAPFPMKNLRLLRHLPQFAQLRFPKRANLLRRAAPTEYRGILRAPGHGGFHRQRKRPHQGSVDMARLGFARVEIRADTLALSPIICHRMWHIRFAANIIVIRTMLGGQQYVFPIKIPESARRINRSCRSDHACGFRPAEYCTCLKSLPVGTSIRGIFLAVVTAFGHWDRCVKRKLDCQQDDSGIASY